MTSYITVVNRPNKVATVHLATCSFLGANPERSTPSAERVALDGRFEALVAARTGMPGNFGFCGHCQAPYRELLAQMRTAWARMADRPPVLPP
jgi:hypothetical protein